MILGAKTEQKKTNEPHKNQAERNIYKYIDYCVYQFTLRLFIFLSTLANPEWSKCFFALQIRILKIDLFFAFGQVKIDLCKPLITPFIENGC